jgi:DNA-binding transcriptional ArsR family regulator
MNIEYVKLMSSMRGIDAIYTLLKMNAFRGDDSIIYSVVKLQAMSDITGLSINTIRKALKKLEEVGVVLVIKEQCNSQYFVLGKGDNYFIDEVFSARAEKCIKVPFLSNDTDDTL